MNYSIFFMLSLITGQTLIVRCDEQQPNESKASTDIQKLTTQTVAKSTESIVTPESVAKDGDTLETLPSMQSSFSWPKPPSPIHIDMGAYSAGALQHTQKSIGSQYDSQSQAGQQSSLHYQPLQLNYNTGAGNSDGALVTSQQQHSYTEQEPIYTQQTYVRQAQSEDNGPEAGQAQTTGAGYRVPELPLSQPGNSQTTSAEQYDKAVQDRPGQGYSGEQSDSYESDGRQRPDDHKQESYGDSGAYRQEDRDQEQRDSDQDRDVFSRGPYYNIHKPIAAQIQVIEEKDEYRGEHKDGYGGQGGQQSYGLRTQPRPQYKNYKPSGYTPGMLNSYNPPSPPLSSLLPAPAGPSYSSMEQSDDDTYEDSREQTGSRGQQMPDSQALQQQSQTPYGVEVEFDQNQKNEPSVLRGPGDFRPQQSESYNNGDDQSDEQRGQSGDGQSYNREPQRERPNYSSDNSNDNAFENNENRGQDYENSNQLGPKYNTGSDSEGGQGGQGGEQGDYQRGQQQLIKPQEIEYGFIPLSQMKGLVQDFGRQNGYREGRGRGRPDQGYRGPEGYGPQNNRGFGNNGGPHRRPQPPHPYNGGDSVGIMYGGNRGQGDDHRGGQGGFEVNDVYREPVMSPMGAGLNGYRKPAFERPNEEGGYMGPGGYNNNGANKDEEEDMSQDDGDYVGAALKGRGPGHHGSGLPPGASYNPRDVGLDEAVVAQLNLAASAPAGISPGIAAPGLAAHGYRGGLGVHGGPGMETAGYGAGRVQFPNYNSVSNAMPVQRPRPRPQQPYSASGQGYRSQYGYRAAASEVSPVSAAQTSPAGANSPVLSNLLNLNPVKSFRSLMSYLTGGING